MNIDPNQKKWKKSLILAFVFLWPFIYFLPRVISFKGIYAPIGNDFISLYYSYKVYLLDCLSHLRIPLWSPSEAAGFPFYSSPFTQTFYPLNLLLTVYYWLVGGYSALDHQRFTVLGISIFSLGLFFWLRLLRLNLRAVLFATLIMSVSFKMSEILRFPNAVHSAAWYPWILFAITKIFYSQSIKESVKFGLLLLFFLICLFTAGYPYYIYYSQFLFGPYLLLFFIPGLSEKLFANKISNLKRSIVVFLVTCLFSLLICSPYLYKMSSLLKETADRGGGNFAYSTLHLFTFEDTIGSLLFPPAAQGEGWYYFGILGLLLILLYLFSGLYVNKANIRPWYQDPWIKIFFLVWIGTISYITYGRQSYLFAFLWKYMPFFSSLRVWGRLNIILVPIIGWLLATAYTHFEDIVLRDKREWSKWKAISVLVGVYLIVLGVQSYLFRNKLYDIYWTTHFKWIEILRQASKAMADNPSCTTYLDQIAVYSKWLSFQEALFIIFGIVAFSILFVLFLCASRLQSSRSQKALLAGLVLFSMLEMGHTGILMWPGRVLSTQRTRLNIEELNQKSFGIPRTDYNATISLSESFSVGVVPNWYFNRYNQFLHSPKFDPEARKRLLGVIDGRKLYLSEAINYPAIQAFLDDAERFKDFKQVVSYTGEELILDVDAPMKGYLSFIDNWNPDWKATVDGRPVSIELLFGTFKSIQVPVGKHRVVFTYRPKFL